MVDLKGQDFARVGPRKPSLMNFSKRRPYGRTPLFCSYGTNWEKSILGNFEYCIKISAGFPLRIFALFEQKLDITQINKNYHTITQIVSITLCRSLGSYPGETFKLRKLAFR